MGYSELSLGYFGISTEQPVIPGLDHPWIDRKIKFNLVFKLDRRMEKTLIDLISLCCKK